MGALGVKERVREKGPHQRLHFACTPPFQEARIGTVATQNIGIVWSVQLSRFRVSCCQRTLVAPPYGAPINLWRSASPLWT
jgi:hypothetical protein